MAVVVAVLVGVVVVVKERREAKTVAAAVAAGPATVGKAAVMVASPECFRCHSQASDKWRVSHHALAHRDTGSAADDGLAFAGQEVQVDAAHWTFSGGLAAPRIAWHDDQATEVKPVEQTVPMAIGHVPLVQYLVGVGGGRYQVPDMAWDPAKKEWFSIYGKENRRPHEWGHWTQRGMNWNSQCAYCHFTDFHKGYDVASDGYRTTWREQGVGCAQCHGPSRATRGKDECLVDPQQKKKLTPVQWMHSCATCHSRREEFDEAFVIGGNFHDHYRLALPSQPGLWHPDGQQIDEDYNFTSFLLSRMGHKGITCLNCHDSHAAAPIFGREGVDSNAMCLQCHAGGANGAVIIDPANHMFHAPGVKGSRCVDCHMPKKPYMGRDPRSDHRFPSPDPLLTKELGVPNTCNDCHADKGLDWQITWVEKWYGAKMDKPARGRQRTRAVAAAQAGQPGALDKLLAVLEVEEIGAWKATLLRLLEPWAADSRVAAQAVKAAADPDPLARAAAAMLVARRGDRGDLLEKLLADPLRAVRFEAAWGALDRLPEDHPAVREVEAISRQQQDQPAGAMRMARIAALRGRLGEAEAWFRKAAAWDRSSAAPRRDLAVFLASHGRTKETLPLLEEAARLAPTDAELPYLSALALAETGDVAGAEEKLRAAVKIEPTFARAQYNLGLLLAGQGRAPEAIDALRWAEESDRMNADAPYARATIHLRLGDVSAAVAAAREALARNPAHQEARALLEEVEKPR